MDIERDDNNSQNEADGDSWWVEKFRRNEVIALVMVGLALMLLLALISYSPGQLPRWINKTTGAEIQGNFVGPIGATISGYLLFAFGAASFALPVVIVMWAFQILTTKRLFNTRNFIALGLFLVVAACIVDCQVFFFNEWVKRYDLPGSKGGLLGNIIGQQIFVRLFGPAGSFIIMSVLAIFTLVVITGIHPFQFTRKVGEKVSGMFNRVNWEKEWSVWTGNPVRDEVYYTQTTHVLPASEVDIVDSIPSQNFEPDSDPFEDDEEINDLDEELEDELEEDDFEDEPEEIDNSEEFVEDLEPEIAEVPQPKPEPAAKDKAPPVTTPAKKPVINNFSQPHHQPSNAKAKLGSLINSDNFDGYKLPRFDLLKYGPKLEIDQDEDDAVHYAIQNLIVATLESFKVEVTPGEITKGPTITRYEFIPSAGLRVNKITALKDDIALATSAERINILAPIPGKNTVGIEIANSNKVTVTLRELLESRSFSNSKAKLPLVLGKDVYGKVIIGDLSKMPHLLVAGATGSGKSVCINSIIASLVYRYSPQDLKFIMIDPKVVEMQLYNRLPHMVMPVVTDAKKVILALKWVIREMENRYAMFAKKGVRNFEGYNKHSKAKADDGVVQPNLFDTETGEDIFADDSAKGSDDIPEKLPYVVVIIDELADLMQTAQADVETAISRLAQKARAAGIHLVIATQTPRAEVVTGTIKANIPSRIAFQVSSKTDSRIILDENGAENLIGKGDMLYLPPRGAKLTRAQGALITDEEVVDLVEACASQAEPKFEVGLGETADFGFLEEPDEEVTVSDADEEVLNRCMNVIYNERKASTSLFQRKLRLGYTRAARMVDILEARGVIGPGDGAKPREILIDLEPAESEMAEF